MQIKIFRDESIHSYFIRVLILNGKLLSPDDLNGIVSRSGVVNTIPKLDFERGKLFLSYQCAFLEKLISDHTPIKFLQPSDLAEIEDYVLFGVTPTSLDTSCFKGRTQLRYCRNCFNEQISEHGVPWFRVDWLYSTSCTVHNQKLTHVFTHISPCCFKSFNILDCLFSTIRGECCACNRDYWKHGKSLYINSEYPQNYSLIRKVYRLTRS